MTLEALKAKAELLRESKRQALDAEREALTRHFRGEISFGEFDQYTLRLEQARTAYWRVREKIIEIENGSTVPPGTVDEIFVSN